MSAHHVLAATLMIGCLAAPLTASAHTFTWWDDTTEMAITQSRAELVKQVGQYGGLAQLQYVNRVINNAARQQEEEIDIWKGFNRLTREGHGDCEDFAIAKYQILRETGMPAQRLDFLAARDALTPTYHAVLRYRMDNGGYLILDNLTPLILPQAQRTDLTPIVTFDEHHSALWKDQRFVPIAPSQIMLGGTLLSERMTKLMQY
ncbi:transglutaminase-like cysteine peptidase [Kushneria indalinina]|uniref:Transglutaminase-like cysteine proteinase BTLCP n=1 Tax=Kushneria indalinina DSM 14324 TaxID=1122140 RepID=A0A3D9DZH9_9GAMM|nr:transglutaminase-like cysteine peptidase [Kushneria indalinina]REC95729.1 transglutaminase-like cysteine proteinase BTLCP [Kushneria indalinina DSM 14324]